MWFLTHDSEGNKEFQCQILSKLENNIYLVYLYDWLLGQASTMRLFPLDKLLNADFYSTVEDLKEEILEMKRALDQVKKSVPANLSLNFTVSYISPISVQETGNRFPIQDSFTTTTTKINSCVANLYKNGIVDATNNATSSNGFATTHSLLLHTLYYYTLPY